MPMERNDAKRLIEDSLLRAFRNERERLDRIDRWFRWDHDLPHQPRQATNEYKELSGRAQSPWLGLVVTSVAQNLYVDGYRQAESNDDAAPWQWWQVNGLDARQVRLHRAALAYGHAYVSVLPGEDDFREPIPVIRPHSPRRMLAFYAEPEHDDWPMFALRLDPFSRGGERGWTIRLYDDESIHVFQSDSSFDLGRAYDRQDHELGVCPIVRFANQLDLEGRTPGEVEPLIPLAGRIDQTMFDRLVVQRFASFVVRTVSGMSEPATQQEAEATKLLLKVGSLLVSENPDTKFGSLPASPLDGFIEAHKADILDLAAVSQTPAHEMLGQIANLSAEALAAARASLMAKVEERQQVFGESWEQVLRLAGFVMDDPSARDFSAQVQWRDTEIRSLAQAADALGKLAQMLGVPVEMLWERIPTFTQEDVERAKAIVEQGDSLTELTRLLEEQAGGPREGETEG